jgi:hypothetical protein
MKLIVDFYKRTFCKARYRADIVILALHRGHLALHFISLQLYVFNYS